MSSPGTDFSVQDSAQIAYTDLVIDGATSTKCTSAAHPFDSTSPGNVINITAGTGFTVQRVEILSVAAGVATCDKSLGTLGSTGGTGNLGGGFASLGQAASLWVASNKIYIKNGTYTLSSTANVSGGRVNLVPTATDTSPNMIIGYNTNRTATNTDTGPTLQPASASMICVDNNNGNAFVVYNLLFAANSQANCTAIRFNNFAGNTAERCQATGAFAPAFNDAFSVAHFVNCYASGATNGFTSGANGSSLRRCVATACTTAGFNDNNIAGSRYVDCIAFSNTGYGFVSTLGDSHYEGCTSYNNSGANGHGFMGSDRSTYTNCVATGNAKFGFATNQGAGAVLCRLYNCAGFNNTSGNVDSSFGYNLGFQTLSGDPFTNAAGNDFSLNNTAGAGAACRAAGFLASYPGISTSSYPDIGAAQHQDPAGIGTVVINNQTTMVWPDTGCIGY